MDMEHAEALERIEIAAVEPLGLERLMAGDTPDGAAVAGHLAGCPSCTAELDRIRRTATIAREVIAAQPDPALRERTLTLVHAVGRKRPGAAAPVDAPPRVVPAVAQPGRRSGRIPRLAWVAGVAAALIVASAIGFTAGGASRDRSIAGADREIAVLSQTTTLTMRIESQPDARSVSLAATPAGSGATGSLAFSPVTGDLVVIATGLPVEGAGQEYGCWVEVNGDRRRLGRMYWGGDIATWAGPAVGLTDLPPGTVFGVSLGPAGGGTDATPVLTGRL
jgi:hypothetical protein